VPFRPEDTSTKNCQGNQMAVDDGGNVYVAAMCGDYESCLIKFNTDGNYQWQQLRQFDTRYYYSDEHYVLVDSQQQLIYAEIALVNNEYTVVIAKYDADGNMLWENVSEDSCNERIFIGDLQIDKYDNFYLMGHGCVTESFDDHYSGESFSYIVKIDPDGNEEWKNKYYKEDFDSVFIAEPGDEYLIAVFGGYLFLSPALQPDREQ